MSKSRPHRELRATTPSGDDEPDKADEAGDDQSEEVTIIDGGIADEELTDEEFAQRVSQLEKLGRLIGDDRNMEVVTGTKPGWRYIFHPHNRIEMDPDDVRKRGFEYCLGLIGHEGAHRKISRIDFIPKKIWQQRGFSFLMNAVEDPRVNNWFMSKHRGGRKCLERVYDEDLSMEIRLAMIAKKKLGYTPKHKEFGFQVIRYWYTGEFSEEIPDDVREALAETIQFAKLAYENIPDQNPTDDEIDERAQQVYNIIYRTIWPIYEKLVEQAEDDETLRQLLEDMIENGDLEIDFGEGEQEADETEGEEGEGDEGKGKKPISWEDIPEDLRDKIRELIEKKLAEMDPEEREELRKKAKDNLDGLEVDLNEELKGKMTEQPKSKKEEEEEEKERERERKKKAKRAAERKKARAEKEAELEAKRSEYDKTLAEVAPYIDRVAETIINALITKRFPKFRAHFPGQRLRLKGAMVWESRKEYRKLFETRMPLERRRYSFMLLVDLSGSMDGETIQETFKGVVLFTEALQRAASVLGDVEVCVQGFQNGLIPYKGFEDGMSADLRNQMSDMKERTHLPGCGYNNDGVCVDTASQQLEERSEKEKFLIVLSDGIPAPQWSSNVERYQHLDANEQLRRVVQDISSNTKQHLLSIGLGPGTEHVADYYDDSLARVANIPNVDIEELVEKLEQVLLAMIQ